MATDARSPAHGLDDHQFREIRTSLRAKLRARHFDEAFISRAVDDAMSQALLEFTQAGAGGKDIPNPGGWIVQTAFWRCIDQLRREEREAPGAFTSDPPELEEGERLAPAVEDEAISNLAAERLHDAVASLPERHKQALRTYYLLELTTREAADRLRLSEPTFRRRLKAAMKSLRSRLDVGDLEQGDSLAIEVGVAAAATSGQSRWGLGDQVVAAIDNVVHAARETALRFGWGADPATTPIGSAMGRAATQGCAAALSACAAIGVATGGSELAKLADAPTPKAPPRREAGRLPQAPVNRPQVAQPVEQDPIVAPQPASPGGRPDGGGARSSGGRAGGRGGGERALGDEAGTTQQRTEAANSSLGVEGEAAPPVEESAPEPVAPAPEPEASSPTQEANEAFGPGP